jgi:3-oxoacyl-[acyl-carrier protein] reductase
MNKLSNKVVIVTGASKGIGAGIAKAMAAEGACVVVNYGRSLDGATRVVSDIERAGGKAVAAQADMSKVDDVRRLFKESEEAFGPVDVLVNNAGTYEFAAIDDVTEEHFHRHFDLNVLGPLMAIQEAARQFGDRGGAVINLGSVGTRMPAPTSTVYTATKGALDMVTRVLARELGPRNIRVNTISPGGTQTEGLVASGIAGSDFERLMISQTPLGRLGTPDDIARIAVFLASEDAGWITGEILTASGGMA